MQRRGTTEVVEAFDHKLISFIPSDKPFSSNRYKLHIWIDAVKSEPIYEGSTQTIGFFDGYALDLTVNADKPQHNPFKRAMSYQAFRAFKKWGKGFGFTELPEDSDTSVYQGSYKMLREKYKKQLTLDVTDETEDDVDDEEDHSDQDIEGDDEEQGEDNELKLN